MVAPYRTPSPPPTERVLRFYCWPDVAYFAVIVIIGLVVSFGMPLLMRRLVE